MVRLILYNIEYCEGIDGRWYHYLMFWRAFSSPKGLDDKIINSLKKFNPDIVALVEVDTGSIRAGRDEVVYFEKKLGLRSFVEKVKYPIKGLLGLYHYLPVLRKQANALISKYDLYDTRYHMLSQGTKRVVIESRVRCPHEVTLLLAHLSLGREARRHNIIELAEIVNSISGPVIVMGDFNTFEGDSEIWELLSRTHLKHRFSLGSGFTQPAYHPTRRLDYVLTSEELKVSTYEALEVEFSDHLPLHVDFSFK